MMLNGKIGLTAGSSMMTGQLTQQRKREFNKRSSQLFLKPTEEGKFYQLRLLNIGVDDRFRVASNFSHYRDFPFIPQHIHTCWHDVATDNPDKPIRKVCETIVCPQTDYVKANSTLSKGQCPMCKAWASAWKAWTDSKYKNQEAKAKMRALHADFRVLVPVFVVQDPNFEQNNGSVKVVSFDQDAYDALLAQIQAAQGSNVAIWNNDACNLYFSWGKIEKVVHEGQPNEYRFQKNGFTRVGFTTNPKHIDGLTDDVTDDLQFDANWFTVPTKEELDQFYVQNFSNQAANDDIPMDIPPLAAKPVPKPVAHVDVGIPEPAAPAPVPAAPAAPAPDPLASDPEDIPAADMDARINSILAQQGII